MSEAERRELINANFFDKGPTVRLLARMSTRADKSRQTITEKIGELTTKVNIQAAEKAAEVKNYEPKFGSAMTDLMITLCKDQSDRELMEELQVVEIPDDVTGT